MAPFVPLPDALTQPFWDGCKRHVITVQKCRSCGRMRHRPSAGCHHCGGDTADWVELSGRGTVYTCTIVRRAFHPAFTEDVPYAVGLVSAEEDETVRFHTRFVECDPADIAVGTGVDVVFEPDATGIVLPFWRPRRAD